MNANRLILIFILVTFNMKICAQEKVTTENNAIAKDSAKSEFVKKCKLEMNENKTGELRPKSYHSQIDEYCSCIGEKIAALLN